MPDNMMNPGALVAAGARDASAGELDGPENILDARSLQVERLAKRFNLSLRTAAALAPLVFGEVTA